MDTGDKPQAGQYAIPRSEPRARANFKVTYRASGESYEATAVDLSHSGIGIVGPKVFPEGAELELRFRPPQQVEGALICMAARVRNVSGSRMGMELVNVGLNQERIIETLKHLFGQDDA